MRVGSIGYATVQGLGVLLKDFYDNGIITDVVTVKHWKYANHDWYRGPTTSLNGFDPLVAREFIKTMDVMFFFETSFDPQLISYCRSYGVKTILMPMYECTPAFLPGNEPDLILNPSELDQQHYPQGKLVQVPIPKFIQWRSRQRAKVFVHNAGHGGLNGRNGTKELLEALPLIQSPIKLILRLQESWDIPNYVVNDPRVDMRVGTFSREELYEEGDVFIFPEKFNGLSLPLQEAAASGMLVMASNRFPMNTWLSNDALIPIDGERHARPYNFVLESIVSPRVIARMVDEWYDKDITQQSLEGWMYGRDCSWDVCKDMYMQHILGVALQW